MSLEIAIQENTIAIRALIDALTGVNTLPEAPKVQEETKNPITDDSNPFDEPSAAPLQKTIAYSDVKKAVVDLVTGKSTEAAKSVLANFGVASAKDLPEDKWPAVYEALTAALEA